MVRKIKVVYVYSQEAEQANEPDIELVDDDADNDDITEETPELNNEEIKEEEPPKSKKQVLDMPTTDKKVQQVQSLACGKNMSAINLR
jgi:hypothetical protein